MRLFSTSVLDCQDLGAGYSWLTLSGCEALDGSQAGQFVMMRGPWGRDPTLPRAYSILWVHGGRAEFLIRRVGPGSERLGSLRPGESVMLLGPIGRGFPTPDDSQDDLLVAGGCGIAPLFMAARQALAAGRGQRCRLLCGARQSCDLVLLEKLAELGLSIGVCTEDGSRGATGLVTDLLEVELQSAKASAPPRILACGPEAMLRAVREVARRHGARCFVAVEAAMACGLGACLGCAVPARDQPFLYVCQQGPVFDAEEIWP